MQTFLPYPDLQKSISCLDYKRLGKQRVESFQIINILQNKQTSNAWIHHPAVLMWKDHIDWLIVYYNLCLKEWSKRGYRNVVLQLKQTNFYGKFCPEWFGNEKLHASHRSNLLRKDFQYYSQFNWTETNDLPYYWPIKHNK